MSARERDKRCRRNARNRRTRRLWWIGRPACTQHRLSKCYAADGPFAPNRRDTETVAARIPWASLDGRRRCQPGRAERKLCSKRTLPFRYWSLWPRSRAAEMHNIIIFRRPLCRIYCIASTTQRTGYQGWMARGRFDSRAGLNFVLVDKTLTITVRVSQLVGFNTEINKFRLIIQKLYLHRVPRYKSYLVPL